jgi:hypothetical protein
VTGIDRFAAGRGLTLDGKLFIAGTVASSLDSFYAFMNPTWAMNAHAVSLGTWSTHIPLFANPGQNDSAWGLLWCLPAARTAVNPARPCAPPNTSNASETTVRPRPT